MASLLRQYAPTLPSTMPIKPAFGPTEKLLLPFDHSGKHRNVIKGLLSRSPHEASPGSKSSRTIRYLFDVNLSGLSGSYTISNKYLIVE